MNIDTNVYFDPKWIHQSWLSKPYAVWRIDYKHPDGVMLSVDVPGVKQEDLLVEIDGMRVNVTGTRFDTKASVNLTYLLSKPCIKESAVASLDHGILTIEIAYVPAPAKHKVNVVIK